MEIIWDCKVEDGLGKINNSKIDPSINKDRFLGVERTKISNQATRRISKKYSFKDRSFQGKDRSFPFYNDLSEILEIQTPKISCQGSILDVQGLILLRQTTLQNQSCNFFEWPKLLFGPKQVFFKFPKQRQAIKLNKSDPLKRSINSKDFIA